MKRQCYIILHAAGVAYITKKVPTYDVYRTACGYNYYSKNLQYHKLNTGVYYVLI